MGIVGKTYQSRDLFRGGSAAGLGAHALRLSFVCATSGFIGGALARIHCIMLAIVVWESILVCEISSLE